MNGSKRLLSFMMALLLLMALGGAAWAAKDPALFGNREIDRDRLRWNDAPQYDGAGTSLSIPDTVTEIEYNDYGDLSELQTVSLPASLKSIGSDVFSGSTKLTDVYYGGTEIQWGTITIAEGNDPLLRADKHFTEPATPAATEAPTVPDPTVLPEVSPAPVPGGVNDLDAARAIREERWLDAAEILRQLADLTA